MAEFSIGQVVKLRSGGHEMTVQEASEDQINCVWSDGKGIRSASIDRRLLVAKDAPIAGINIVLVYPDKDVDGMVEAMRQISKVSDDNGFHISDDDARKILKRRLGPKSEQRDEPLTDAQEE